jgi:L-alanine-DL-glutamate epimerase-like enolase superfamily enzyme
LDGSLDLATDFTDAGFILKDGVMRLSDAPGLGV